MSIDTERWTDIDTTGYDTAGIGYSRLSLLVREDPFVRMLSQDAIDGLLAAIFDPRGYGVTIEDRLQVTTGDEVRTRVRGVFAKSPLAIVNDGFIEHVANLTVKAIFPRSA